MALEHVGLEQNPNVVVLCIYTDDFRRVHPYYAGMGFKVPRLTLNSGHLEKVPHPDLSMLERTRIFQAAYRFYWDYSQLERKLHEAILFRFIALANEHHFSLVIVYLPGRAKTGSWRKIDKERGEWVHQYAQTHQIPFLDVTKAVHEPLHDEVFIKKNPHFNANGHRIVATELAQFLDGIVNKQ